MQRYVAQALEKSVVESACGCQQALLILVVTTVGPVEVTLNAVGLTHKFLEQHGELPVELLLALVGDHALRRCLAAGLIADRGLGYIPSGLNGHVLGIEVITGNGVTGHHLGGHVYGIIIRGIIIRGIIVRGFILLGFDLGAHDALGTLLALALVRNLGIGLDQLDHRADTNLAGLYQLQKRTHPVATKG